MKFSVFRSLFIWALIPLWLTGCATTKPRPVDQAPTTALVSQVAQLQGELQNKDQEIQELQTRLESKHAARPTKNFSKASPATIIRVSGVSVKDLQRALVRAGFDPGSVDGKPGKKTKSAVKDFQRKNNMKPDGIVGEKTWALLKA